MWFRGCDLALLCLCLNWSISLNQSLIKITKLASSCVPVHGKDVSGLM